MTAHHHFDEPASLIDQDAYRAEQLRAELNDFWGTAYHVVPLGADLIQSMLFNRTGNDITLYTASPRLTLPCVPAPAAPSTGKPVSLAIHTVPRTGLIPTLPSASSHPEHLATTQRPPTTSPSWNPSTTQPPPWETPSCGAQPPPIPHSTGPNQWAPRVLPSGRSDWSDCSPRSRR